MKTTSANGPQAPDSTLPRAARLGGILAASFVVGLSGALMPGSLLALTVGTVAAHGFWAGPLIVLGHAIAELAAVLALVKGLGKLLQRQAVIGTIGIVGGMFLLWTAWGLFASVSQPVNLQGSATAAGTRLGMVGSGFFVSVTNPYWVLWWTTVGATYVAWSLQIRQIAGLSVFYFGHELSDVAWYTIVSIAVAGGARFLKPAVYQGLLVVCGAAMLLLGGYFGVSGIRKLVASKLVASAGKKFV